MMVRRVRVTLAILAVLLGSLESSSAMAAILRVTNCGDSGAGTLRQQLAGATAGDTIVLPVCQITLTSAGLFVGTNLSFLGAGPARTVIDGSGLNQVFSLSS